MSGSLRGLSVVVMLVLASACGSESDDTAPSVESTTAPSVEPTVATMSASTTEVVTFDVFLLADGQECTEVMAVAFPAVSADPVAEALAVLLSGPTADDSAAGAVSWFSDDTSDLLGAVVVEDGTATVDFSAEMQQIIPNATSSCGAEGLLAQLDTTLLQFENVDDVVYRFDGDAAAFYEWLQMEPPPGAG